MAPAPEFHTLRTTRHGFVLTVTLDHAATRNALTNAMVAELLAMLDLAEATPDIRVIVLRGGDGMFCSGADLKTTIAKLADGDAGLAAIANDNSLAGLLFARFAQTGLPTVAVIEGPAFGGGFGLACCADIVLATQQARFSLSETTLGLIPAQIAPYVVARLGQATAKRLALTARRFDGREAATLGLVDHFCADAAEIETVLGSVLTGIGRCAPDANARTKQLLQTVREGITPASIAVAADQFIACLRGPEGREGIAAFIDKRPANWVSKP